MTKAQITITMECVPDDSNDKPDERDDGFWPSKDPNAAGWVLPENFDSEMEKAQKRMRDWEHGYWQFIGVRAVASIKVPYGRDWIVTRIKSPGLWGIESDAGEDYLAEVFAEEKATLLEMLESLKEYEVV